MKDKIIETMYEMSKKPYQKFLKHNQPWNITKEELVSYPELSLGNDLGRFLTSNQFDIQEKLEDHDIIHVLTNTGITVVDEISMQYYLLGNGKRSLYLYMVILTGTVFYPMLFNRFMKAYKKGKRAHKFYYLDFLKLLHVPTDTLRQIFNIN
ncbi:MAG TPA: hypothetical protein VJL37_08385 [Flavobacterium sp.]|nr:hypothetical protein [Flavobacterium sp.]